MNAIARYIVTGFFGLVIGVILTLTLSGKHDAQEVAKTANDVTQQTAQLNVTAVADSAVIEQKREDLKETAAAVKEAVSHDLAPKEKIVYVRVNVPGVAEAQLCPPVSGNSVLPLSIGGVRLLNDLRAAKTVDLTSLTADEIEASANVTVAAFVDNDIDVVQAYNDLRLRNDELIDRVVAYMKEQAAGK